MISKGQMKDAGVNRSPADQFYLLVAQGPFSSQKFSLRRPYRDTT
ncbi:hypothetical protein PAMC26577_37845 [Caballeronia sordidicola]|uniref:Uncharacterized protein n=1 Tax=Caballeronia sordidicola TaxID=196367 RepID=A0A242M5I1_CABSO|nr:hypothetical protein PAMC26577_37845 [Caballeronia sordidicola]